MVINFREPGEFGEGANMARAPKPFRIRPYRAIGGYVLICQDWQSYWYPSIAAAMDHVAQLSKLRAI